MKFTTRLLLSVGFLLAISWAHGQDIHYNYDRTANFAGYKTYQWVDLSAGVPDPLIDQSIKRAIDEQLAAKGLTKVEKDADVYIGYQAVISMEKRLNMWGTSDGPWGGGGWGTRTAQAETSSVPVGLLVVDLYDPTRKLVWRGDATKTIDLKKDPDKNYRNLQKVMAKLFRNYPPQPNK